VKPLLDKLRIFDVRYSLENVDHGRNAFKAQRISGAGFVDLDADLCKWYTPTTARHPLPTAEDFIAYCKSRGIGPKPVLCYDDHSGGMGACRMWWMLDSLGIEAYVLNGGIQAAIEEGIPTESGDATEAEVPSTEWNFKTSFDKSLSIHEVPIGAKYIDARFAIRYNSTVRPYGLDTVAGHVPASVNHPWNSNVVETAPGKPTLIAEEELKEKMGKSIGGTDASNHVFACASGVTACINIAVAKHCGYGKPFLYSGSWSEYAGLYTFQLRRDIVDKHGLCFVMKSKNLAANPKYNGSNGQVVVDGVATAEPDADVAAAAAHMHLGESATVSFRGGRVVSIDVQAK